MKALLLLTICAVAAGVTASTAAADVIVNPFVCQVFQGGAITVPAGSEPITIRSGVSEQTLGILKAYLNAQKTTISTSGATTDVSNAWSDPVDNGPGQGWSSRVTYPTGISLESPGDALVVVWTTTLAHPVPEVFNPAGGGPGGKPVFNDAPVTYTCTVTAV